MRRKILGKKTPLLLVPALVALAVALEIVNKLAKHRKCSQGLRLKIYRIKRVIIAFYYELAACDIGVSVEVSYEPQTEAPKSQSDDCCPEPKYCFKIKLVGCSEPFRFHLPVRVATFVSPADITHS